MAGTAAGLYFVLNQDLSHGEGHGDEHHGEEHEKHDEEPEEEESKEEPKEEEAKPDEKQDEPKEESKEKPKEESKEESKDESKDEDPAKSDAVSVSVLLMQAMRLINQSLLPARNPSLLTRLLESRRACLTQIPSTPRPSLNNRRRARRVRALRRRPNSRAPSQATDLPPKTRKIEERPRRTRTSRPVSWAISELFSVSILAFKRTFSTCRYLYITWHRSLIKLNLVPTQLSFAFVQVVIEPLII